MRVTSLIVKQLIGLKVIPPVLEGTE